MKRTTFIQKWLGNPDKKYTEQFIDEMRDDLDLVCDNQNQELKDDTYIKGYRDGLGNRNWWMEQNKELIEENYSLKLLIDVKEDEAKLLPTVTNALGEATERIKELKNWMVIAAQYITNVDIIDKYKKLLNKK